MLLLPDSWLALVKFISFCQQLGKLHPSGSPCPTDKWMLCFFVTFLTWTLQHSSIRFINLASELSTLIRGSQIYLQTVSACKGSHVVSSISRALLPPQGCLLQMTFADYLAVFGSRPSGSHDVLGSLFPGVLRLSACVGVYST